jgi:hypothetical protein
LFEMIIISSKPESPTLLRPTAGWFSTVGLCLPLLFLATFTPLGAQEGGGSAGAAVAGAALGGFSGAAFGLAAGLVPCSMMRDGLNCARVLGVTGGIVGATSGTIIGAQDRDLLRDHLWTATFGAAIGGALGFILKGAVRHYGWIDAGAGVVLGAAFGAAPRGAGIGFAAGAVTGATLFFILPQVGVGDAAGLSLLGMAAGGLAQWIASAQNAGDDRGPGFEATVLSFSF